MSARIAFATGMIALALICFVYGDFAQTWQAVPVSTSARHVLAYASAALMGACGIALFPTRTEAAAARVLGYYWALLVLFVELPIVIKHPLNEIAWQGMAHLTMLLAAAWMLSTADARARKIAQVLFGLALIPVGLAHFVYLELTAPLVPAWLPFHSFWAYFTGAAQLAAALGVLLGICPALAAGLEAVLLATFTFLVWPPLIIAAPAKPGLWSELAISWAMCASAWVVAVHLAKRPPGASIRARLP